MPQVYILNAPLLKIFSLPFSHFLKFLFVSFSFLILSFYFIPTFEVFAPCPIHVIILICPTTEFFFYFPPSFLRFLKFHFFSFYFYYFYYIQYIFSGICPMPHAPTTL